MDDHKVEGWKIVMNEHLSRLYRITQLTAHMMFYKVL